MVRKNKTKNNRVQKINKVRVDYRFKRTLVAAIRKVSKQENRTMTNLVETVMEYYCSNKLNDNAEKTKRQD